MPRVPKKVLIFIAGLLWISVGMFLIKLGYNWFSELSPIQITAAIIIGLVLGSIISYFGFSKIAIKNIARINLYEKKVCVWAFQKWTSYLLVAFMMSLGIFLRNSILPKYILTPIYFGIGFALLTASYRYFLFLFKR
ncbi:MAG: hypothetical protein PF484_14625 [Bacteroidales bacterium]|jgi:hypothetical protein|nr:hypothetical protein [Bacteroidales bacterium]